MAGTTGTTADGPQPIRIGYTGDANDLAPLVLETILFNLSTLTLYRFWSRSRVRRHLWSRIDVDGDGLEYSGRGLEMLIGFLIVLVVVLIPLAVGAALLQLWNPLAALLLYPIPAFLIGVAIWRARSYRLSRTLWRGIRFAQTGGALDYALIAFAWGILSTISLGLMTPMKENALWSYAIRRTHFGDRTFSYKGGSGALFGPYIAAYVARLVLAVFIFPLAAALFVGLFALVGTGLDNVAEIAAGSSLATLALIAGVAAASYLIFGAAVAAVQAPMAWYYASQFNTFAKRTTIDGLSLRMKATGGSVAGLVVGNALIMLSTLGLGRPFAQMRTFRYVASRLRTEGNIDLSAIGPSPWAKPGLGEGLADAFDVGAV